MFPDWSWILGFIIGAFVGSFLNMVIYRLPRGLSFVEPSRSFCPRCKHPLGMADLMPLLSWLSTRGKCRYCHEPVAARYFWVEVLTACLFAGLWWQHLIASYDPLKANFAMAVAACLVAVIFIDAELYIIPDELNAALTILGVGYHVAAGRPMDALGGALLGWGLIYGILLLGRLALGKDAMGDGDVKMMRGVGAFLGPTLLFVNLGMAVVAGLIGGIIGIAMMKRHSATLAEDAGEVGEPPPPTPIPFVLLAGVWYLFCLDIVALFIKPLNRWIESKLPAEVMEEEESWKPTFTTIPFGPYLALGALVCMLFPQAIDAGVQAYLGYAFPKPRA